MSRCPAVPGAVPLAAPIDHRCLTLLGVAARPFAREGWGWESKFDGYRALAFLEGGVVRILTRNGNDITPAFPEVAAALARIGVDVVLDGELTIADARGRPDWNAVRRRAVMKGPRAIAADAVAHPATLWSFDLLALARRDVRQSGWPSIER
jgi:bifunctional non-homologous end joining protein LigD